MGMPFVSASQFDGSVGNDGRTTLIGFARRDETTTASSPTPVAMANFRYNGASFDREFTCPSSAVINVAAGATQEIVALTSSQIIRVCSIVISADTLATTATFSYGTGTTCGTGNVALTGAMRLQDEGNISISAENGSLMRTAASNALCIAAATGAVTGFISYLKY
jgi:hypothetical protein